MAKAELHNQPPRLSSVAALRSRVADRSVPAGDDEVSQNAIGLSRQSGAVAFATTHWSVVLEAQGESPAAQDALERRLYT